MADEVELDLWNAEYEDEVKVDDLSNLVVYSRDWTVETIFSQIVQKNIDLEPAFQRRNAWNDHKRSKLIESLVAGLPVPQIVLAEDLKKKGSFIVIDGKQRLLALSGFIDPTTFPYWTAPRLKNIATRADLSGMSFDDLGDAKHEADLRQLMNADIRCTIITGYKSDHVLYDIFYRLNSASVPLSSQELRQVLNRGDFSKYIMEATSNVIPLHTVMGLSGADSRLRDAEILLRYVGLVVMGKSYNGNLSSFLDSVLKHGNENWAEVGEKLRKIIHDFNEAVQLVSDVLPEAKAGRKFSNGRWESRFNRVLLEVEAYYFPMVGRDRLISAKADFVAKLQEFMSQDAAFLDSIESTTKTVERYYTRFKKFENFLNDYFNLKIDCVPTPKPE